MTGSYPIHSDLDEFYVKQVKEFGILIVPSCPSAHRN